MTISEVVEHGFHIEGVTRESRIEQADLDRFTITLAYRHRLWAFTVATFVNLAPSGGDAVGNRTRILFGGRHARDLDLGRREDRIVDKATAKAIEVWTQHMSPWSLAWTCSETALSTYLRIAPQRRATRESSTTS